MRDAFRAIHDLPPDLVDRFVSASHERPGAAIQMLKRNGALAGAPSSWGETALQAASHLGHRALLRALVTAGVGLDVFAASAMADRTAVIALLTPENRGALGVHGLPLLHFGIVSRNPTVLALLIGKGVPVNPTNASLPPLHSAVVVGEAYAVEMLCLAGADLDATDAFGATAAEWALDIHGSRSDAFGVLRAYEAAVASESLTRRLVT